MPLHTDPEGRFSFMAPDSWRPLRDGGWMPAAGSDPVRVYAHTSMSGDRTVGLMAAYRMRPGAGVYALQASRRTLMLDGCPAERVAWVEAKQHGARASTVECAIDLGDVLIQLHIWASEAEIPAAPEIDAAIGSFRLLRDPMAHLSDRNREAYAGRIAECRARLADPSLRDYLDETIDAIAAGLGRDAERRQREIEALTPDACRLAHPRLGVMTFDPDRESWSAPLLLAGAPAPFTVLIFTQAQADFAAEREMALTRLDWAADRLAAVAAHWTWAELTRFVAEDVTPTYNEHWRDEDDTPDPLDVGDMASRLAPGGGYASETERGPTLSLYLDVADDLFAGHQVEALIAEDGAITLCGLAG